MRQAEKRLDKFWATVDNHCEAHTSYSVLYLLMVRRRPFALDGSPLLTD
jgi:hypothetical protein